MNAFNDENVRDIEKIVKKFGCNEPTPIPQAMKVIPIIDTSGYVYEAVESNRVEGVIATIFERS